MKLAEGPGVVRGEKKIWTFFFLISILYSLRHPPATHECPQKISAIRSNRLAGYRQHTYIYINVFFYSIDIFIIITNIFSLYIGISYNLHIIDLLQ